MISCCYCSNALDKLTTSSAVPSLAACPQCFNPIVLSPENGTWNCQTPKLWQDIRTSGPEDSIGRQILKICIESVDQLPVLPSIAHRITEIVRDPNTVIGDITEIIKSDPVIAMRILRVANSAMYAGLSEIKDLHAACVRLGMKTVVGIVHAIGNGRLYVTQEPAFRAMMQNLWRHALATAYCAGELAMSLAQPNKDVFFIAGLIHDIGKVAMLDAVSNVLHNRELPAVKALRASEKLLAEVMETYHPLIGLHIVQFWNLPADFRVIAFCHENLDAIPSDTWTVLNNVVTLSSVIANVSGYGLETADNNTSLVGHPATKSLGLTDIKIAALRVKLEDNVNALLEAASVSE